MPVFLLFPLPFFRPPIAASLPRLAGGAVASVLVLEHLRRIAHVARAAQLLQPQPQHHAQPVANLLRRHLWIFPPEAGPPERTRSPSSSDTGSGAASARYSPGPRSASGR